MKPAFELAGILNGHWSEVQQSGRFNTWQLRTLNALRRCRTGALGGHIDGCTTCGHLRISYNSCRNRHCPKCQGTEREKWIEAREEELLPIPYFHVVFTLPDTLNGLCLYKPAVLYNLLFQTAWKVINTFGQDHKWLGAQSGMIAVLHTWGQTLTLHPHLHCIVPGGGLTNAGKWKTAKNKGKYLFPVRAMSRVFRGKFIDTLKELLPAEMPTALVNALYKNNWVVYAKRPFATPSSVIEYLGRYTHKIAISNHRIKNTTEQGVTFGYKDYRHHSAKKEMTLDSLEFIRRFSLHILPKGLVRIRHYGILSSSSKKTAALTIKGQVPPYQPLPNTRPAPQSYNPGKCPCCMQETMQPLLHIKHRGPPENYLQTAADLLYLLI